MSVLERGPELLLLVEDERARSTHPLQRGVDHPEGAEEDQAALEALQQAVRMQPRFCVGYFRMGQVYFEQGEFAQADEALTQSLNADPSCAERYQEAYALRGEVRARLGRREEAMSDFERCVELGATSTAGRSCQNFLEDTN